MMHLFRNIASTVALLLGAALLAACHSEEEKTDTFVAGRTVVVYMVGENSLSSYMYDDMQEMAQAVGDIPQGSNLILYVDGRSTPMIYRYTADASGNLKSETVREFTEDVISTDSAVMSSILRDIFAEFPAESYGLVLWSHGDGWLPDNSRPRQSAPATRYIGIDNGSNSGSNSGRKLNIDELAGVIEGLLDKPLEFIFFDACFMQTAEVAYELRNVTRSIVTTPAEIPGPGAPYQLLIAPMFASPQADVDGMVRAYVSYYNDNNVSEGGVRYGVLLSRVDCSKMQPLAEATARLLPRYFAPDAPLHLGDALCYYPEVSSLRYEYYDMGSVMRRQLSADDYAAWQPLFDEAVPLRMATEWWYSGRFGTLSLDLGEYGGLSFYIPQEGSAYSNFNESFRTTGWYTAAGWDAAGW